MLTRTVQHFPLLDILPSEHAWQSVHPTDAHAQQTEPAPPLPGKRARKHQLLSVQFFIFCIDHSSKAINYSPQWGADRAFPKATPSSVTARYKCYLMSSAWHIAHIDSLMSLTEDPTDRQLVESSCSLGFWCTYNGICLDMSLPLVFIQAPHSHSNRHFWMPLCTLQTSIVSC